MSLVLCHAPASVCLNVYWNSIETSHQLLPLQEFGSDGRGGRLSYELTVAPSACSWNPAADVPGVQECEWTSLDTVYATLLTEYQWLNLTQRLAEIDTLGRVGCMQPSAVRAQLSFEHWQDTQLIAGLREGPASPERLVFNATVPLPVRTDRYLFALFNCLSSPISVAGRVSFEDAGGEQLSVPQRSLLSLRLLMLGGTAAAALLYAALALAQRAVTVPLQWTLVLVFLLHSAHQALSLPPLLAAARGAWVRRGTGGSVIERSTPPEEGVPPDSLDLLAEAALLLALLGFMVVLLALSAGRRFLVSVLPLREREVFGTSLLLYLGFGMLEAACTGEVSCGVFLLSFQVVRILIIFAILLFLNASSARSATVQGHQWEELHKELPRLLALRKLRWRLLLVYLVLPILIMFLEVQVLDWRAAWFRLLWREALDLYLVSLVAWLLRPGAATYAVHFAWLRPAPNMQLSPTYYARFFRFLLGSGVDTERADAAVANLGRQ